MDEKEQPVTHDELNRAFGEIYNRIRKLHYLNRQNPSFVIACIECNKIIFEKKRELEKRIDNSSNSEVNH